MDLYKEILSAVIGQREIHITFPDLKVNATEIVELASYSALQKIKAVIEDDSLEDAECFMKIEAIVETFEALGSHAGSRHDFG